MKRKLLGFAVIGILGISGLIWIINRPNPMIRRPIAQKAPILLFPTYINLDFYYRQSINYVEFADQLIYDATSSADIELAQEKVELAQENLNAIPLSFLGYERKRYCLFFQCSWDFTIDEYKTVSDDIAELEDTIFKEKKALDELEEIEAIIKQAKEEYSTDDTPPEQQEQIIDSWQMAIDRLNEISTKTVAGRLAQTKLLTYNPDFEEIVGIKTTSQHSDTMMSAAEQFALAAVQMCENPPYSENIWEQCRNLWQEAIAPLEEIAPKDIGYLEAQTLLSQYKYNLANVELRKQQEIDATEILATAKIRIESLLASIPAKPKDLNFDPTIRQLQSIIKQLEQVDAVTTVYSQAQQLIQEAQNKLKELQ